LDEAAGTSQTADERPALMLRRAVPSLQAVVPELLSRVGMRPVAQLEDAEVSTRLATGATADTAAQPKASGARLIGADLRFASAERVFLPLSDLRHADLLGANLRWADLRGANLSGASFVGALLVDADVRKVRAKEMVAARNDSAGHLAYIDTLFCARTSFAAANMRYARMNGGDFRGASFDDALLQGATFARARVTHASFVGADLDGTDFRGAVGLTADQVLAARHVGALFDSTLLASLRARSPDKFVGYNAAAIAAETEVQRLSGEDEPDTPTAAEEAAREDLMRRAYDDGPAPGLSTSDKNAWVEQGRTSPASTDAVPQGCVMTRATRERR
ncbi:MAG: pentapeptide repeat-containing protein, partial [Polyangiaceae bacterium]